MNWNLLSLSLPVITALIAAAAVYFKPTPALLARRWLTRSMLCAALIGLLLIHYYVPNLRYSVALDLLYDAAMLCLAPCFYMCLRSLTSLHGIRPKHYLIFLPGTLLMGIIAVLCLAMGADESQSALAEIVLRARPVSDGHSWAFSAYEFFGHQFFRSYAILSVMAVLTWGAFAIRDYQSQLQDYLVDISPALLRGIRLLYFSFVLLSLVGLVLASFEYAETFSPWFMPAFSICTAISFALMAYFARLVTYSAEQLSEGESFLGKNEGTGETGETSGTNYSSKTSETSGSSSSSDSSETSDPFLSRLAIIEREHLYRDPNLTIFTLARTIGTNRTYLTRAFRECYGESFSERINRLRIEEAIRLMTESPQMPLHEVATRVGYNSPTSLYRNFIRLYHCSPSEYLRHNTKPS